MMHEVIEAEKLKQIVNTIENIEAEREDVIAKVKGTSKLHEKGTREFGVT